VSKKKTDGIVTLPTPTQRQYKPLDMTEIENKIKAISSVLSPEVFLSARVIQDIIGDIDYTSLRQSDINIVASKISAVTGKSGILYPDVLKHLVDVVDSITDAWYGISTYLGEHKGRMYVETKTGREYVSNFVLIPKYTVNIDTKDLKTVLYVFDAVNFKTKRSAEIKLSAAHFNTLKEFQTQLAEQIPDVGCVIQGLQGAMLSLYHRYVVLGFGDSTPEKTGTVVLGYERLTDEGDKFFCSTNGSVYSSEGVISDALLYMGDRSPALDSGIVDSLGNLDYCPETWKNQIAPYFLKNAMKLHAKDNMLLILGWIGALPHEFNIRKEHAIFPLLHVAGQQGAGKSTIIQALKPYLGYTSEGLDTFPTPPNITKAATVGYTIPLIYDEYGGSDRVNGWPRERFNATHEVMKDIVAKITKKKMGKGEGGQGSFVYKMRASMISLGQSFLADPSIETRAVQIYVYSAFHKTEEGKQAKETVEKLLSAKDKNFWTGFNIWCMQQNDNEVRSTVKNLLKNTSSVKNSRQKSIASILMTGLMHLLKLGKELGLTEEELGYTESDIARVPSIMTEVTATANAGHEEDNILFEFLRDIANDGYTVGNTPQSGQVYGKGYGVCSHFPATNSAGKYGTPVRDACVFGTPLILIDIETLCNHLNRKNGNRRYVLKDLNVYIQSEFQAAMQAGGDGLVLAPNGYVVRTNGLRKRYTAFHRNNLIELAPDFAGIKNID